MNILVIAVLTTHPFILPADFNIQTRTPEETNAVAQSSGPLPLAPPPDEQSSDGDEGSTIPPIRPKPHFSTANGFGTAVPLAFAVRQIVPSAVRVSYGPGVNPTRPVDWKGGRPWNRVLAAAVSPLGYHVVTGKMNVAIRE